MNEEIIQPIVLVGGRSRRFGRDKLLEPWEGGVLVDRPIRALEAAFGARVAVVGECDPAVAARAHAVIDDRYPGVGPIGGILSALEQSGGGVFVLPGDLPRITPEAVRIVLGAAAEDQDAWAVAAVSERGPEACIGLYRPAAAGALRTAVAQKAYRLQDALPRDRVQFVALPAAVLVNANTPGDLTAPEPESQGAATSTPPLHRHPALQPLSREHFNGLVQARRLRWAAEWDENERRPVIEGYAAAWRDEISPHFDDEERLLGPHAEPADAARLRAEHETLRALTREVIAAGERAAPERLRLLGRLLHDHIRWEERVLFPALQETIGETEMARIGHATRAVEAQRPGARRRGDAGPDSPR